MSPPISLFRHLFYPASNHCYWFHSFNILLKIILNINIYSISFPSLYINGKKYMYIILLFFLTLQYDGYLPISGH